MSVDRIANALTNIKNCENASRKSCVIYPASSLLREILSVMKENGFVNRVEWRDKRGAPEAEVFLEGKINECRVIKPRYAVKKDEFEKFEKRFLPSRDIGILIVSTPKGVFTHRKAREAGVGGRLLAYVF